MQILPHTPRTWLGKVKALYARQKGVCHLCGRRLPPLEDRFFQGDRAPSLDHLVPRSQGGGDQLTNLAVAHIRCNRMRGTRPLTEEEMQRAGVCLEQNEDDRGGGAC